jgi:microcystin-dependent protein
MSDPFLGEIRAFAFSYAPENWAFCDGQQLPMSQFQALYAIIGSLYGPATPAALTLPDLRGRVPMQWGAQPGEPSFMQGAPVGAETVTLSESQLPAHTHQMNGVTNPTASLLTQNPTTTSQLFRPLQASTNVGFLAWNTDNTPDGQMAEASVQDTGGGQAHENRQPYLTLNFCICLDGDWPRKP